MGAKGQLAQSAAFLEPPGVRAVRVRGFSTEGAYGKAGGATAGRRSLLLYVVLPPGIIGLRGAIKQRWHHHSHPVDRRR